MSSNEKPKTLNFAESVSIVVGIVIGAGIFVLPATVAQSAGSTSKTLASWLLAGAISGCGAYLYSHLGRAFPQSGGTYIYLHRAFGPFVGFLAAWTFCFAYLTGEVAWLARMFSAQIVAQYGLNTNREIPIALFLLVSLTILNLSTLRVGAITQVVTTLLKVIGVCILIITGFIIHHPQTNYASTGHIDSSASFGVALLACLLAYDGWASLANIAGEIRNPVSHFGRALLVGVGLVIVIYISTTVSLLTLYGFSGLKQVSQPAVAALRLGFGDRGALIIGIIILISIISSCNGLLLTTSRLLFAQQQDSVAFSFIGKLSSAGVPTRAVAIQGMWSCLLVLIPRSSSLIIYSLAAAWFFYGMVGIAIFPLSRRHSNQLPMPRLLKISATIFTISSFIVVLSAFVSRPLEGLGSIAVVILGIPLYFIGRKPARGYQDPACVIGPSS